MTSNSLSSKLQKLEKIVMEIKDSFKGNLKKLQNNLEVKKKFEEINKKFLDLKEKIGSKMFSKEEKIEKEEPEKNIAEPISEPEESPEDIEKKKKREVVFEMALFLILGVLLGITIKTEAVKRITIGFNDYKMIEGKQGYNFKEMEKVLEQKATTAQDMQQSAGAQTQQ